MDPSPLEAEMQQWRAAADLVRADLEATTDLRWPLQVEVRSSRREHGALGFNYGTEDTGLPVLPADSELADAWHQGRLPADVTLTGLMTSQLAGMMNENVMEEFERPWPECNVHRRPLDPTPVGPTGTWQCSKDPAHAAPIGGLAGMVGPRRLLDFT
ncbi:hypothetical protein acdb102_10990 [Acidothermaceae bacterium B102]|nr:hypothetical protein acdb102_10990 [Acidothermaceae bacterium B102]